MPIPYILVGIAAVSGAFGVGKNIQAGVRGKKAKDIIKEAQEIYDTAKESFDKQRESTLSDLNALGKIKLNVWSNEVTSFLDYFNCFKKVEVSNQINTNEIVSANDVKCDIQNMTRASVTAKEIVKGGVATVGAGAVAGIATYGGTLLFAHASTGTAIAALNGAAQTNAALAFIGGGAKAAGGLGMAGGSAVLGGVIVGPVLAVQGLITASKAKEHLAKAEEALSQSKLAAEQMMTMEEMLSKVSEISDDYKAFLLSFCQKYDNVIEGVKALYNRAYEEQSTGFWNKLKKVFGVKYKLNFRKLSTEDQKYLQYSWLVTQILYKALAASIMDENGSIDQNAIKNLDDAKLSAGRLLR